MKDMTAQERKDHPIARGVLDYFPDALLEVAHVSKVGNDQHNPGEPMHWAKEKSTDEADALLRHLIDRGKRDSDGMRHSAKVAWRALAMLQREIEAERAFYKDDPANPVQKIAKSASEVYSTPLDRGGYIGLTRGPKPGDITYGELSRI